MGYEDDLRLTVDYVGRGGMQWGSNDDSHFKPPFLFNHTNYDIAHVAPRAVIVSIQ
jgi:hypothetical protein